MVRLTIFCACFVFSFTSTILIAVGCFTEKWWISKNPYFEAGIWKQCYRKRCFSYDDIFDMKKLKNGTNRPNIKGMFCHDLLFG